VLLDTEQVWDEVRGRYVLERGGHYDAAAQRAMMGMSSAEWSRYLYEELAVPDAPEEINAEVVRRMIERYREDLPLVDGAREAVERLAARWPLGLASSSNRPLIDAALELSGLSSRFRATVSSEEVARGKPAPDVYLEAAARLRIPPTKCAAVEDSHNGIRSARAAEMRVIAIPNAHYPPGETALEEADVVLRSISELTPETISG
jgi:HAD superfamily hydrolase (TIGR01509 family)